MHLPDLSYDCIGCGRSCTEFQVEIDAAEASRLPKALRVIDDRTFLGKEPDGRCSYLTSDTRCSVHPIRPTTCRDFPFRAIDTPAGVFIGASFLCTAIARGHGRPLEAHRNELAARYPHTEHSPNDRWPLWDDLAVDWPTYERLEALMNESLDDLHAAAVRVGRMVSGRSVGAFETRPLLIGLIALLETTGEGVEAAAEAHRALAEGRLVHSRALGKAIGFSDRALPVGYREEERRYLGHVLFRKTLLEPPDVLSRIALMPVLAEALAFYARAAGDVWAAQAVLEGRALMHASGMHDYFKHVGSELVRRA